jgi:glycine oxidase
MREVVVVGGGIAGAAVALELRDRGAAVTVIDAERPGAAATGASGGMLAPQYESAGPSPLFDLLLAARSLHDGFAARVESLSRRAIHLRWDGMLVANRTAAEHDAAVRAEAWQRSAGLPAELLDPAAAATLQPGLGTALSLLWLPAEGHLDSQALAAALPEALAAAGARVISRSAVTGIVSAGGAATGVRLADGRVVEGERVVLAAGAWSAAVAGLPRPLPVRPVRGHMLRFPAARTALTRLVTTHGGRYLVPRFDGTILAGSTMDEVGFDRSLSDAGLDGVRRAAAELLPDLAGREPVERWADLRPLTRDGLPILGPDPRLDGLFYATGYGRNGILFGPLAGRIIADLITDGATPYRWEPCSVGRLDGA